MTHNFFPGDRVKWTRKIGRTAEGVVVQRGVENRKHYIIVAFDKPMQFKKRFEGDDIKKVRRA